MNDLELAQFLARLNIADNRQIDKLTLAHWRDMIGEYAIEDAIAALVMHFKTSTAYLQPAHIIENIKSVRDEQHKALSRELFNNPQTRHTLKPRNFNALAAAARAGDTVAWEREIAIWNEYLIENNEEPVDLAPPELKATYPVYSRKPRDPDAWMQPAA
jgi:hypothetical protein